MLVVSINFLIELNIGSKRRKSCLANYSSASQRKNCSHLIRVLSFIFLNAFCRCFSFCNVSISFYFLFVCICVCIHVYVCIFMWVPAHTRIWLQMLWSWNYKHLGTTQHGCWDSNSSVVEVQQALLADEKFLQPHRLYTFDYTSITLIFPNQLPHFYYLESHLNGIILLL